MNGFPFDVPRPVVTVILPVAAVAGTPAVIEVSDHEEIVVAETPLNFNREVPCAAPKFMPVIVTSVIPAIPDAGDTDETAGT